MNAVSFPESAKKNGKNAANLEKSLMSHFKIIVMKIALDFSRGACNYYLINNRANLR